MSSNVIYTSNKRETSEASAEPVTPSPSTPKRSKLVSEDAPIIKNTEQFSEASQPESQHTEYSPADPVTRPQSPQPCSQPQEPRPDPRSDLQMGSKTSKDSVESATQHQAHQRKASKKHAPLRPLSRSHTLQRRWTFRVTSSFI